MFIEPSGAIADVYQEECSMGDRLASVDCWEDVEKGMALIRNTDKTKSFGLFTHYLLNSYRCRRRVFTAKTVSVGFIQGLSLKLVYNIHTHTHTHTHIIICTLPFFHSDSRPSLLLSFFLSLSLSLSVSPSLSFYVCVSLSLSLFVCVSLSLSLSFCLSLFVCVSVSVCVCVCVCLSHCLSGTCIAAVSSSLPRYYCACSVRFQDFVNHSQFQLVMVVGWPETYVGQASQVRTVLR